MNTLLATALSDAHGLVVENLSSARINRLFPSGLPPFVLFAGRGLMSDDTEHAAIVAQAFSASAGNLALFERELAKRLKRWLWALPPATGMATARALIKLTIGFSPANSGVYSAGNGACMRAPILGRLVDNPQQLWSLVSCSSLITHTDTRATEGAFAIALWTHMSRLAARPVSLEELTAGMFAFSVSENSAVIQVIKEVSQSLKQGESSAYFVKKQGWKNGPSGYVMQTMPVVFHLVLGKKKSWEDAVRCAVQLGGDTDTIAALVGAMRSVLPNQSPPAKWVEQWQDWPRTAHWLSQVEDCAQRVARTGVAEHPPEVFWLFGLFRNLVLLIVILGHGIRRGFPPY